MRSARPRRRALLLLLLGGVLVATIGGWSLRRFAVPPGVLYERAPNDIDLHLVPVADSFKEPVYVTSFDDVLYVIEKAGVVKRIVAGAVEDVAFLDASEDVMTDTWERGMYSIAFHPRYPEDGRVYVAYTAKPDGRMVVAEYRRAEDTGQASEPSRIILEVPKPTYPDGDPIDSHNGGQLRFGPNDGYLYVSLGDGTRPSLTNFNAQDLGDLWGSILRIDIDHGDPYAVPSDNPFLDEPGARPEVWAYGFRNPWRFSFDPDGSTIWLADVGQGTYEEIDRVVAGGNYGWPIREGRLWSWRNNLKAMGITKATWYRVGHIVSVSGTYLSRLGQRLTPPVVDYGHVEIDPLGGQTVIVGSIYNGNAIPDLHGRLVFGDFITGRIWSLELPPSGLPVRREMLDTDMLVTAFTEDSHGNLYIADYAGGSVLRLVPGSQDDM